MLRFLTQFLPPGIRNTMRTATRWVFGLIGIGLCIGAVMMLYPIGSTLLETGSIPESEMMNLFIGGVMFLIGVMFVFSFFSNRDQRYAEAETHDEPWTLRKEWNANTIKHEYSNRKLLILGALFLVGGSVFGGWLVFDQIIGISNPEWGVLMAFIFPLVGGVMLAIAFQEYRRRRKYGTSVMRLDEMPARLGERLLAQVQANISAHEIPENGIQVQISCYKRTARYEHKSSSDGKSSRTVKATMHVLWRNERHMRPLSESADGIEIPVSFLLPENRPTSTPIRRSDKYLARNRTSDIIWRVRIRVETDDGVDYNATFEVPVFESEDTSKAPAPTPDEAEDNISSEQVFWDLETDEEKLGPASEKTEPAVSDPYDEYVVRPSLNAPISPNISLERRSGYLRLHVAPDRSKLTPYLFGALGIGMMIGSLFVFGIHFWGGLGFLVLGALLVWAAYSELTKEATLTISNGTIDVKGAATFGKSDTNIPISDFKDVLVMVGGDEKQADYRIVIERHETELSDGRMQEAAGKFADTMGMIVGEEHVDQMKTAYDEKKHRAASIDGLHNKMEADWIAEQIRETVESEARYA